MKNPPKFTPAMIVSCQRTVDAHWTVIKAGKISGKWKRRCRLCLISRYSDCKDCPLAYYRGTVVKSGCGCVSMSSEASRTFCDRRIVIDSNSDTFFEAHIKKVFRARLAFLLKRFRAMGIPIK